MTSVRRYPLAILRQGAGVWNLWRNHDFFGDVDLDGADLSDANLPGIDLHNVYFPHANLAGANLNGALIKEAYLPDANLQGTRLAGAILDSTDFSYADLTSADLAGARCYRTDFEGATLEKAKLQNADLRQALLIDSCLDRAILTGVQLWESQRAGWSIERVTCRKAFWDRDGILVSNYSPRQFEHLFGEKPRIVLRYTGGIAPVDLAMLPIIIEKLQSKHPGCALHVRSMEDAGSEAVVTITVDHTKRRNRDAREAEVSLLRLEITAIQQRLQQEEHLRLKFESNYWMLVKDIFPQLLSAALPKQELFIGQVIGSAVIEGDTMSKDTYNIHGQAGAVGRGARARDMSLRQLQSQPNLNFSELAEELAALRNALRKEGATTDQRATMDKVARAEKAAARSDETAVFRYLRSAGIGVLGLAEKIGVPVAVEALKRALSAT